MSGLKEYFSAGLRMEEAREEREKARAKLRAAAQKHCPEELAELDAASKAVEASEKAFGQAITNVVESQREGAHRMLHDSGVDCGDPKCVLNRRFTGGGSGAN